MKIAILGGQFNPPHLGHLIMAQQVLEFSSVKEVWLTPCYQHTFDKNMAPVAHRGAMTKLICTKELKYCDEEVKNKLSGNTIELMDILTKKYPEHEFSFIIGSDNLPCFKKWGQWEKLIKKYIFWVVPRAKHDTDLKNYGLDNPNFKFQVVNHNLLAITNISSTMIRNRVKNNISIINLVPQNIREYINKNNLFI